MGMMRIDGGYATALRKGHVHKVERGRWLYDLTNYRDLNHRLSYHTIEINVTSELYTFMFSSASQAWLLHFAVI